ncbi:hypothetical protein INT47_000262 [Mucor saturninus]|uniref:Uncharacterized protein n=1 Tax=Mucor saturninus TaxID=64648 RepID=A0A8H7QHK4_9FUNG|nr:hypothetical protein INT47_000262 [Mucor saturninus]
MIRKLPSTILLQDTLDRRLAGKVNVRSHHYDVCPQGCQLFQKNDEETLNCSSCNETRYANLTTRRPSRQMKMMSVGDRIASVLANDRFRELMKYRHNYQFEENVYKDYFDGQEYQSLKADTRFFSSEDDVAMALFFDEFQPGKAATGDKLSIIHLVNLNFPPEYRFQNEYMIQLAILPGPNTPKDLDFFLQPIVDEFRDLSNHGLVIRRNGDVVCKSKVNLVIATGDIPAAASLAHHSGHMSTNGCRLCRIVTKRVNSRTCYLDTTASLREKADFTTGSSDFEKGINIEPLLTSLPTFTHPTFFALEELHLIGQGIAKHVYDLLTVSMKKTYNKAIALKYAPTDKELEEENITSANDWPFSFKISKYKLIEIGNFIELSRPTVPTTFSSKWENPIEQSRGNRGVVAITQWNNFLLSEIRQKRIQPGVLKPVQHYLTHVPMMIEKQGILKAYSGRSMERTTGRYKKLIKSKVNAGANAGNVLERFAVYGHVNSSNINLRETLNLLEPKQRTNNDFVPLDENDNTAPELWSPLFQCSVSSLPCGVSDRQFISALQRNYMRVYSVPYEPVNISSGVVNGAGRAWFNDIVYTSAFFKDHINERRRGNNYVMFTASHLNHHNNLTSQLYVGSITFFFETTFKSLRDFLVLIDVAESHGVVDYERLMPKVILRRPGQHKYVVCRFGDIICNVGLLRYTMAENHYKVISHHIFTELLDLKMGNARNL